METDAGRVRMRLEDKGDGREKREEREREEGVEWVVGSGVVLVC